MIPDSRKEEIKKLIEELDSGFCHSDRYFMIGYLTKDEAEFASEYYLGAYPREGYGTSARILEGDYKFFVKFYRYHSCD